MRRGEIWWAEFAKPVGSRPVLLLSRDRAYRVRTSVTIATVTRTIRSIPTEVKLGPGDGMEHKCVVNLDDIQTIEKERLVRHIATLSREKMSKVNAAIEYALDLHS